MRSNRKTSRRKSIRVNKRGIIKTSRRKSRRVNKRKSRKIGRRSFKFGYSNEDILMSAARDGDIETVEAMLSNGVNPAANNNEAIIRASMNGHSEIVRLLLTDGRADPAARNNEAIMWSSARGHREVVRLLLADSRVDPTANNSEAIILASIFGKSEVVDALINDSRVRANYSNLPEDVKRIITRKNIRKFVKKSSGAAKIKSYLKKRREDWYTPVDGSIYKRLEERFNKQKTS